MIALGGLIAGLSGLSLAATIVGLTVGIIAAIVIIYMYTVSRIGQETTQLQDQANDAQEKIINAMKLDIESLKAQSAAQAATITHLTLQNKMLTEQVTQAAKVDALRESIESHRKKVDDTFDLFNTKLDLVLSGGETHGKQTRTA